MRVEEWAGRIRGFVERHRRELLRWRERVWLREETFHLILAAGTGVIAGLLNVGFYVCTESFKRLALRHSGDLIEIAGLLEWWQRWLAPAVGGLVAGLVLYWGLRMVGGGASGGNLLEVVVAGDGRLGFRTGLIKSISSLVSQATGGSLGREGALANLSATVASKLGQWAKWPPYRLRLLVACGAGGGMAAAYNAPIAGAVFAAQIVLGSFSMNWFAPLVVASVSATVVSRAFFGIEPWYRVPTEMEFTSLAQLPWFLVLGVMGGVTGAWFLGSVRRVESWMEDRVTLLPVRMAIGGAVVGTIAIGFPEVWGNGYGPANRILTETLPIGFLFALVLAKWAATVATVGSGAVGGVFTPTLFLGAGLGAALGRGLHGAGLAVDLPVAAFALVGMGATCSATTHSALLAMILIFEISLKYTLMPPLMVACAVSALVSRRIHPGSVYTEPLRRRGLEVGESLRLGAATAQRVADLMREPVKPVRENTPFRALVDRFLSSPNNFLPVVNGVGRLVGVVALHDLKEHLTAGSDLPGVIAVDVMRPPPAVLVPNQTLAEALPVLVGSEQRNIPVVDSRVGMRLVGSLGRAEALGVISDAIAQSTLPGGKGGEG